MKYYFISTDKFKIISSEQSKKDIIKKTKKIIKNKKYKDTQIVLLKKTKIKESKSKMIKTGVIKIELFYYNVIDLKLTINEKSKLNNIIFYDKIYYQKYGIKHTDLRKIVKASFNNKLEKRLLAPKMISQIKNIKL